MIKITNCPITNLERFVTKKNLLFYETAEQVILECHISHFKDGVIVNNDRIRNYRKNLVATKDTPVNKTTGIKVTSVNVTRINVDENDVETSVIEESTKKDDIFADPNVVSEYAFFEALRHVPIVQITLQEQIIAARDAEGKFNG